MLTDEQRFGRACIVRGIRDHEPFRDVRLGEDDGIGISGISNNYRCEVKDCEDGGD